MKRTGIRLLLTATALAACFAGCRREKEAPDNYLLAGLEDDEEAFGATLDASEGAVQGPAAFAPESGVASFAGCTGSISGSDFISVCARQVPGNRSISWSCTGPNGNGVSGTASIMTTVIDDTDCPNVTIQHDVDFARTLNIGIFRGELAGQSTVTLTLDSANRSAQRTVQANLTRLVYRNDNLIRDQSLTGSRVADLAANGAGPDDDTRTVNGDAHIEFNRADATLDLTSTNLVWERGCCHPVSGTVDYTFGGNFTGEGTVTFGPACGDAADEEGDIGLASCPLFTP